MLTRHFGMLNRITVFAIIDKNDGYVDTYDGMLIIYNGMSNKNDGMLTNMSGRLINMYDVDQYDGM